MEPSPLLKQKMERFDFSNPPIDPSELARQLTEMMLKENGIGLAANQLGLPFNVFVIKSNPVICAFNPKVVDYIGEEVYMDEGCLSYPGLIVKIKRPEGIRIRFTQPNGETITREYHGMTARIVQHEMDHLDGIVFYERANKIHKDRAFRQWHSWKKKNG